jgi:hypothetical protein
LDFLPSKRRLLHCEHDVVGTILRHLDEGEAVGDLDGAKFARAETGLCRDRPDEIRGTNASLAAGTDEKARDITTTSLIPRGWPRATCGVAANRRFSMARLADFNFDVPFRRRLGQLDRRRRHIHDVEFLGQGFDHHAHIVQVALEQAFA